MAQDLEVLTPGTEMRRLEDRRLVAAGADQLAEGREGLGAQALEPNLHDLRHA
jgi:hypothetical protein